MGEKVKVQKWSGEWVAYIEMLSMKTSNNWIITMYHINEKIMKIVTGFYDDLSLGVKRLVIAN